MSFHIVNYIKFVVCSGLFISLTTQAVPFNISFKPSIEQSKIVCMNESGTRLSLLKKIEQEIVSNQVYDFYSIEVHFQTIDLLKKNFMYSESTWINRAEDTVKLDKLENYHEFAVGKHLSLEHYHLSKLKINFFDKSLKKIDLSLDGHFKHPFSKSIWNRAGKKQISFMGKVSSEGETISFELKCTVHVSL